MAEAKVKEITLPVAGMSCAACVSKVEKALEGLDGVAAAKVNLAASKAGVEYDPAACSVAQIRKAVRDLGYQVSDKAEGEAALDRERQARQREVRVQLINLLIAAPPGLPVMGRPLR